MLDMKAQELESGLCQHVKRKFRSAAQVTAAYFRDPGLSR